VIPNSTFLGYANATPGAPTVDKGAATEISLADFYDPANKKYKVLHINVAAVWCNPCNEETDALTAKGTAGGLAKKGGALLSALSEGSTMGTGATLQDLTAWIKTKDIDYNMVVDPEAMNLGFIFNQGAIPFNADIDVRTMELLDAQTGYDGMIAEDIDAQIAWVESHPPSYGCPSGYALSKNSCVAN
jgi:hypothetical protein